MLRLLPPSLRRHPYLVDCNPPSRTPTRVFLASLVVLAALSTAWGCHRSEIHVELPSGYSGRVSIYCSSDAAPPPTIVVNSSGTGLGAPCAEPTDNVLVVRDGQRVPIDGHVRWLKTGDNIATGLEFTVR